MNTKKLISGKLLKKIKNFCVKGVFSLLIATFFVGGMFPLISVFSGSPEISGTEISYAETPEVDNAQIMKDAQNANMSTDLKKKISEFAALMISIFQPLISV